MVAIADNQRAARQPVDQLVAIGRCEDGVQRVAAMWLAVPSGDRQQMEIMVAEDRARGVAERRHFAENFQRFRAPIDQIPDEPQAIAVFGKPDQVEKLAKLGMTTLNVADRVERHGCVTSRRIPCNRRRP